MTAGLLPVPKARFFDLAGNPLAGGLLYTYQAGTTTPLTTYTSFAANVANTNPVVLDSAGYADVWLNGVYKFVLQNSSGVQQWSEDNIAGSGAGSNYYQDTGGTNAYIITPSPASAGYGTGNVYDIKIANGNTGASTLNVNNLGIKNIIYADGSALRSGAMPTGSVVRLIYDDNSFQLQNILSTNPSVANITSGTISGVTINNSAIGATGASTALFTTVGTTGTITVSRTSGGGASPALILINSSNTANTSIDIDLQPSATSGQGYIIRAQNDGSNNVNLNFLQNVAGSGTLRAQLLFAGGLNLNSPTGSTGAGDLNITGKVRQNGVNTSNLAWVNFTGATGAINASFNVTSVTRNSAGDYTIAYTAAVPDANYCPIASCIGGATRPITVNVKTGTTPSTSSFNITAQDTANTATDPTKVYVNVTGN